MDRLARTLPLAALALLACNPRPAPPSGGAPSASASASAPQPVGVPLLGVTPLSTVEVAAPREPLTGEYRGAIDPGLRIVMRLSRDGGDAVSGRYFYESKGIDLVVHGKVASDGVFTLEERNDRKVTGTFSGAVGPNGELTGTWDAPAGGRRPFRVEPVPTRARGPAVIVKKWYRSRQKAKQPAPRSSPIGGCSIDIAYPEVLGLASAHVEDVINDKLRLALARDHHEGACDAPFVTNGGYAVHTNRAGVLSVSFTYDTACDLCAHPSFGGAVVNVLLESGADLPLERLLADKGRSKLFVALEAPVRDRIKATLGATAEDAPMLRSHYLAGDYVLEDKGLRLIAFFRLPHAVQALDGDFGVLLPWASIRAALDPTSPAAPIWSAPP